MHKGITYHIITIVAVFTALGLGIFIGSMLNGEQLMVTQQSKLMQELGQNLTLMTKENERLKNEVKSINDQVIFKNQLIQYLYQSYADSRLSGYNVAVVITGERETYGEIKDLMQNAGANIVSVTSILDLDSIDNIEVFRSVQYGEKVELPNEEVNTTVNNFASYAAARLMYSIVSGQHTYLINQMVHLKYIEASGDYSKTVDYVIFIGPNKNGREYMELIDVPMLKVTKNKNIPSIIVEQSNSEYSAIDIFKTMGFSTVDHIDTVPGKISLLMVMEGAKGNFGIKKSSTSLLPDFSSVQSKAMDYQVEVQP